MDVYKRMMLTMKTIFSTALIGALAAGTALPLYASDMNGKNVTVYDGGGKQVIRTQADSFKKMFSESRIRLGQHDTYWASTDKPEENAVVYIERAVPVLIQDGKTTKKIFTSQQTIQGAVNDAGIDWKSKMPLEPELAHVKADMTIHVVPYVKQVTERTEAIPVNYAKWYDDRLAPGAEEIIDPGRPGQRAVTVEEYIADGKVIHTEVIKSEILDRGTDGAARVGTQSGTVGKVFRMTATAYHPTDGDGRGITATGTKAGYGTVAVDPRVIPLGSAVYVPGYGSAVAADTGGAIIGHRIDLCMETFAECFDFGVQPVEVYVSY